MQKSLCVLSLALLATLPLAASTPDGQTPSEETVCDGQTGAAYGLCTAYCEAMDCDSPAPHASPTACSRVAENFTRITGLPLPCDVTCPCPEDLPLFAAFVDGSERVVECIATPAFINVSAADNQFSTVVSSTESFCRDNIEGPSMMLTEAEALVCRLLLRDAAAAWGVTCMLPE